MRGFPERDISSLGAMDWGLARLENSSAAVAAAAVALWLLDGGGMIYDEI